MTSSTILWIPSDIEEEHEIGDAQGLFEGKYRLMESYKRHREAVNGYKEHREKVKRVTKTVWIVRSDKGYGEYRVTDKGAEKCDCEEINLHCYGCPACPRRFDCSCPDGRKAGITCKHVHSCLLYGFDQDDDTISETAPSLRDKRAREIDMDHDYLINDERDVVPMPMAQIVDEEYMRERQQKEQRIALAYQEAYKLLNIAKRRIELAKRRENDDQLEEFVEGMRECIQKLEDLDPRGNVPLPNRARGHVKFIPAAIGKRGRPRTVEDSSADPLRVLPSDEMKTCNVCLNELAPKQGRIRPGGEEEEMEMEEEVDDWVQCYNCTIWYHAVCLSAGSLCLSCLNGIIGVDNEDE